MYCVMIGDVVNSKNINPLERGEMEQVFLKTFNRINALYQEDIFVRFATVRGDSFEGVLMSSHHAPQIALEIIEALYPHIIRIVIVLGSLTNMRDTLDTSSIDGPAFHTANEILNKMKKQRGDGWLHIAMQTPSPAQSIVDSLLALLSAHTRSWTDRQRQLVWAMERFADQQKFVAQKFSISPAAISKQLKAVDYVAYKQTWMALEKYLYSLDIKKDDTEVQSFTTLLNYGHDKKRQKEYRAALVCYMRAFKRAEVELGKTHPQLAYTHYKMAEMFIELEQYDKAEETLNQALQLLAPQPRGYLEKARIINALAQIKIVSSQYKEAEDYFSEALSICSYNLGLGHPIAAEIYNGIASMYVKRNEYAEALQAYAHVLTIYEKILGADHPRTADICSQVSDLYVVMQEWDKAAVFGRKAAKTYEARYGSRHPKTSQTTQRLSQVLASKQIGDEVGLLG